MLCSNEKEGGVSFDFRRARLFRDFVNECGVIEESTKSCFYTQRNGRGSEDFLQESLDRVLANSTLMMGFPNLTVEVPSNIKSYHNVLIYDSLLRANPSKKLCFKYKIKWQEEEGYDEVVKEECNSFNYGRPMGKFC